MQATKILLLLLCAPLVSAFVNKAPNTAALHVRGGTSLHLMSPAEISSMVTENLQPGPYGVLSLTCIASAVCVPLTQIKKLYGIGVAYGFSVAAIGVTLLSTYGETSSALPTSLAYATVFYGLRLGSFLLLRDQTSYKKLPPDDSGDRLQRFPFAISLAIFYAFLTTPLLYVMSNFSETSILVPLSQAGVFLAWVGAIMEAIADFQKYALKQKQGEAKSGIFEGPTTGVYQITRHPNYTGEVLFWLGLYLAGASCFGDSIAGWAASSVGLYGIFTIMQGATKKLEERQAEKYGKQAKYQQWRGQVKGALFPFVDI
ncbi:hypothetical protein FisN_19Lh078 [Fistulifera solaris]|uniref:Uncharacterized protein n=1 Tax=Fistulifera solaris TaxID=1519565 RepID=A0A1Z5J721_FISSO|nr:hypothetical protein FisN_19Lh078 [Fistulifera solaris]|eukprot:GAX09618.1 hypothetical protein FisN_19Lh078 [Fistulifera solaris]